MTTVELNDGDSIIIFRKNGDMDVQLPEQDDDAIIEKGTPSYKVTLCMFLLADPEAEKWMSDRITAQVEALEDEG